MKCSNRGRLTWNSNASPKFDFLHANTKETWNMHVIDMNLNLIQMHMQDRAPDVYYFS